MDKKMFIFKMSINGVRSGFSLVTQMQPTWDLQNAYIMFNHVKCVDGWTIMACHVYDPMYCKMLTIAICDMQSKDTEAQQLMWTKLNETMLKHKFPKPTFKGFMANNAQANQNMVKIVDGSRDPFVKMVDKDCTCLFHWIQSLDKHTKQLIKLELQDEYKTFCHMYKNARHPLGMLIVFML